MSAGEDTSKHSGTSGDESLEGKEKRAAAEIGNDAEQIDDNDDPSLTDDLYAVERGEIPPSSDDKEESDTSSASETDAVGASDALDDSALEGGSSDEEDEEFLPTSSDNVPPASTDDTEEDEEDEEDDEEDDDEEDDELAGSRMPLTAHLLDLRKRMVRSFIAVAVGFIACYPFSKELFGYLMDPMTKVLQTGSFIYTYPPEAFFTYIKVSLVAGVFATSPFIFYQMWQFIAPGLYDHERKILIPIALLSAIFFVSGACFGYFVVFPFGFEFFASFSNESIVFMPKLSEYLGFALKLLFAFGVVFEMPIFVLFLAKLGMCTARGMRKFRKYAILLAFVVSAILTPPDVITQTLMAGPLILLYEISILVAYTFGKKEKPAEEVEEDSEDGAEAENEVDSPDGEADATKSGSA